jgi:hypothetical protein
VGEKAFRAPDLAFNIDFYEDAVARVEDGCP